MNKNFFIFSLFFLLSAIFAFASEYSEIGTSDHDFIVDSGSFNTDDKPITLTTRSGNFKFVPLISDLDNNGTNEIIVLDGTTLRIFANRNLEVISSALTNVSGLAHMIIFDIDGDNKKEIIIASARREVIEIFDFNGSLLSLNISLARAATSSSGEVLLSCRGVNDCIVVYFDFRNCLGDPANLIAHTFNITSIGTANTIFTDGQTNSLGCFPKIPYITAIDYDEDGTVEYIYSFVITKLASDAAYIHYLDINESNNVPILEQSITISDSLSIFDQISSSCGAGWTAGIECSGKYGNILTSPLVFDIDAPSGNHLETIVGLMLDDDEFKMASFNSDGSFEDDYPEIFHADGVIVSNPIRANTFTDTGQQDFCVLGFDKEDQRLDLLCASEATSQIPETDEFFLLDISGFFNISQDYGDLAIITHATQQSDATISGNNLDEFIFSFGVFRLDYVGINELQALWTNPKTNGVTIAIDVENVSESDIIVLQPNNLWYIDDQFINTKGEIQYYFINPCIDNIWKQNTSVEVRIQTFDFDSDLTRARAILYHDTPNSLDSNWSSFGVTGTTFSFSFIANVTTSVPKILRLVVQDIENLNQNDTIDVSFTVATNGVVFGDCTTEVNIDPISVVIPLNATPPTTETNLGNNTIANIVTALKNRTGLGSTVLWLLLMAAIGFWIFTQSPSKDVHVTTGVIGIIELLLFIVGALLGFLSTGIIITIVVMALVIIGIFFGRVFFNPRGSP